MALALGEHRDEHVGPGHLLAAGGLHMDRGALQDPLEARRRLGVLVMVGDQVGQFVIDIVEDVAPQPVEIDATGAQDGDRVLILRQRQQQMLERRILVAALIGMCESPMQRLFEIA